ncbi:hypothetical protein BD309DRAFT_992290 [Dichomitus squalens]|uniref:uncharacterized protein n=1 Tax=Dichomitus squalens (strain LYAD-421) TaxID=732165 RepID=UPI0004410D94|nr:uncharacterized protein DICSQDRAFT_145745 [Dichomitus squalens LYAD-421 SS1]EJF63535.1 hypothetical protein DICSQDRAFT_145745 [Dichomitus squalens LYAD-421 SS1]TBU41608.1 hypothetical protein BD309DRAFT_992290 [Dichomitus squalens]
MLDGASLLAGHRGTLLRATIAPEGTHVLAPFIRLCTATFRSSQRMVRAASHRRSHSAYTYADRAGAPRITRRHPRPVAMANVHASRVPRDVDDPCLVQHEHDRDPIGDAMLLHLRRCGVRENWRRGVRSFSACATLVPVQKDRSVLRRTGYAAI